MFRSEADAGVLAACREAWRGAVAVHPESARDAHRERAMPFRRPSRAEAEAAGLRVREASVVLALFTDAAGTWRAALMERTPYEGVHSGQVSIPGGELEPEDGGWLAAGLREFEEEMGVSISKDQILGPLLPLFIPPSGFAVAPFVAVLGAEPPWQPDPKEVAAVLRPVLDDLAAPSALHPMPVEVSPGRTAAMPAYDVEGRVVWGATALMLTEFALLWRQMRANGLWPR